jgi:hypothetical protein
MISSSIVRQNPSLLMSLPPITMPLRESFDLLSNQTNQSLEPGTVLQ